MDTLLVASIAHLAQCLGGSLGAAIVVLSLAIRIALLPLTVGLARRAQRNQAIARALQPEIETLKKRFSKHPEKLFAELRLLYRKHSYHPFDVPTVIGSFLQLPVFTLVCGAIRRSLTANSTFLWIRNLAAPDFLLTLLILALTALSAWCLPAASPNGRAALLVVQLLVTSVIVWKLAAGLGLYWASSSMVGVLQSLWLRWRSPAPASGAAA